MTYSYKGKSFNLTSTKMGHWHRHSKHNNNPDCVFCEGNMEKVARVLEEYGLIILDVGHAWVKIRAEENYKPFNGGITDETQLLFDLVSGKKDIKERLRIKRNELKAAGVNFICPECTGELVVQDGKYGDFLGCMNFPKCKYTRKLG